MNHDALRRAVTGPAGAGSVHERVLQLQQVRLRTDVESERVSDGLVAPQNDHGVLMVYPEQTTIIHM